MRDPQYLVRDAGNLNDLGHAAVGLVAVRTQISPLILSIALGSPFSHLKNTCPYRVVESNRLEFTLASTVTSGNPYIRVRACPFEIPSVRTTTRLRSILRTARYHSEYARVALRRLLLFLRLSNPSPSCLTRSLTIPSRLLPIIPFPFP